ncbi:MAG: hypothetical protein JW809_14180 [Pirellulales bacterium]|nr:hypothetical protein [Pirellulales bacterium]
MKRIRRWIVAAMCAAVGGGLALGMAISLEPAAAERNGIEDGSVFAGAKIGPVPKAPADDRAAVVSDADDARDEPTLEPTYSGASVLVRPNPALAQKGPVPSPDRSSLGPMLNALLNATAGAAAPADSPESIPLGLPAPSQPLPTNLPAFAPAAPAPAPDALPSQNRITKVTTPQGDLLTMNIQNADIREVLDMLSQQGNLNILAGKDVKGQVSASLVNVDLDSALAAILKSTGYSARREGPYLFVGTATDFETMDRAADRVGTRIYHPNYVTSAELSKLITPILTKEIGVVSVTTAAEKGIPSDETSAGGDNYAGTEAVLVRDFEAVLYQIDQLVADVDVRPMQVHIEAMILSVQLDDKDNFGVNFQLLRDNDDMRLGWGTVPKDFTKFAFDGGLKFGYLDKTLGAFLEALESIGDTNVIATPRLMVLNKHAAEIQIGESKGYVSTTQTETATTQTVEFLELGTLLRIRPFISRDGLIRMEVHPEISDGDVSVQQGLTLPNKDVTQVTTNIMVRDGCTVVIGGLLQDEQKVTRTQIPLIGNLPVVGFAFRNKNEEIVRREIIVLITPHIVYEPDTCREGEKAACEFHRRHSTYAEKMCPISKPSLGRKYVRRAQAAWAAGDRDEALRLAELAVHFDPRSREAIDLRSDIWLGKPHGDHTIQGPPPGAPPTAALDGPAIAPWLLEDLEQGEPADANAAGPRAIHPIDPGQPGNHRDLRPRQ